MLTIKELTKELNVSEALVYVYLREQGLMKFRQEDSSTRPARFLYPDHVLETIKASSSYQTRRTYRKYRKSRNEGIVIGETTVEVEPSMGALFDAANQLVAARTKVLEDKIRDLEEELARRNVDQFKKPLIDAPATTSQKEKMEELIKYICMNSSYNRQGVVHQLKKEFGDFDFETVGLLVSERIIQHLERTKSIYNQENSKF